MSTTTRHHQIRAERARRQARHTRRQGLAYTALAEAAEAQARHYEEHGNSVGQTIAEEEATRLHKTAVEFYDHANTLEAQADHVDPPAPTATDRAEHEPCQKGTTGCSVDHPTDRETDCETW